MNIITSQPSNAGRLLKWLIITAVIALLILFFARKITQLSLPGLGVEAKTAVVDPKCPTPEQKEVIERNLKLYGAGFSQEYPNQIYGSNLLAMAKREGKDESWINVHVHGQYGFIMDGRAVYGDVFDQSVHISPRPLRAIDDRPILIGADWGLTPSAVFGQIDVEGRWHILGEYITEDCAADEFGRLLRSHLIQRFGYAPDIIYGDPAGMQRSQATATSVFDVLHAQGYKVFGAEQSPQIRIDSVRAAFNRSVRGGPGILLDPSCKTLIKGFMGGYQYRRIKVSAERWADKPEKNKYSHPHDALQYLMAEFEAPALRGGEQRPWPRDVDYRMPPVEGAGGWTVWGV